MRLERSLRVTAHSKGVNGTTQVTGRLPYTSPTPPRIQSMTGFVETGSCGFRWTNASRPWSVTHRGHRRVGSGRMTLPRSVALST